MNKKKKMIYLRYSPYYVFTTVRPDLIPEEEIKNLMVMRKSVTKRYDGAKTQIVNKF